MHKCFILTGLTLAIGGSIAAAVELDKWEEPREKAFTLHIPKGWSARSQILRPNPVACVGFIEVSSPDKSMVVFLTNVFPSHAEPSLSTRLRGLKLGDDATDEWGITWKVQYFMSGAKFLTKHVVPSRGVMSTVESEKKVESKTNVLFNDVTETLDCGEVEYTFRNPGEVTARRGYAAAITHRVGGRDTAVWTVEQVTLCESTPSRTAEARQALSIATTTFRYNPEWLQRQHAGNAERMRIITKTNEQVSQMLFDMNRAWARSRDRMMERGSKVRQGLIDVYDPVLDQVHYHVHDSGGNYYWIDNRGNITSTTTHYAPGPEYREMRVLP